MTGAGNGEPGGRVFFALVPDAPLQAALGIVARDLARDVGGRPVRDSNIHMTLAFIGKATAQTIELLRELGLGLRGSAFTLRLDKLGAFRKAEVAWIAPSIAPEPLVALHADLCADLIDCGVTIEARPFSPHVTLVRRSARLPRALLDAPLDWRVGAISLMQSVPTRDGVRYAELARHELAR